MATATRKRAAKTKKKFRTVTLWFAYPKDGGYDDVEVFVSKPRLYHPDSYYDADARFTDKKGKPESFERGNLTDLCVKDVRRVLGLNLGPNDVIPVTFTFGRIAKAAEPKKGGDRG